MQTNNVINLILSLYYACNNNTVQHYYIKHNNKLKHIKIHTSNTYATNLYKHYYTVFNSNKLNMCFNTKCKNYKNCIYAQLKVAYKHITNATFNNMSLLKYLQFYSNKNYKYINKYKIRNNLFLLTTKINKCTCSNFINAT